MLQSSDAQAGYYGHGYYGYGHGYGYGHRYYKRHCYKRWHKVKIKYWGHYGPYYKWVWRPVKRCRY